MKKTKNKKQKKGKNYDILPEDFSGEDYMVWFW